MKKADKILSIFLCLVVLLAIFGICFSLFQSEMVVESYSAVIDIEDDGSITVNERVEIDYRTLKNERWRDILIGKNHDLNPLFDDIDRELYVDDEPYFINGEVVSVTKDGIDITNNVRIAYSYNDELDKFGEPICPPDGQNGESLYVDATKAGGLEGVVVFEYRYQIGGMITSYNDIAELNYRMFEYMEGTVKYAAIEVYFNKDTTLMDDNMFYSYGHGISDGEIVQTINNKTLVTQPDYLITGKNIKSDDMLEFRLLFPNEVVSGISGNNKVLVDMKDDILGYEYGLYLKTRNAQIAAISINIITVVAVFLLVVLIYIAYKKYDKEYKAVFDGEYYREIPNINRTPAEMSYLYYFGKNNDEDITATMLDLVRKKVFTLDTVGESVNENNPDFVLYLNKEIYDTTSLKLHEMKLVKWFIEVIGDGEKVSFKQIENYGGSYTGAQVFQKCGLEFNKSIKDVCKNYNFFDKFSITGKSKAMVSGVLLILLLLISFLVGSFYAVEAGINYIIMLILIVIYYFYVSSIKKRSKEGNEEYAKWKAFKKFLEDFSSFEDYPIPGVVVWEEYLVYATSLKIADRVMEQLEVKLPEYDESECTYLRTHYHGHYYRRYLYFRTFNNVIGNARRTATSTISAHNARSNGSGRGGGFSVGSSFGGGGGGGRSR